MLGQQYGQTVAKGFDIVQVSTTAFKTGFKAKSSEKAVGKAGGGKGSEAC